MGKYWRFILSWRRVCSYSSYLRNILLSAISRFSWISTLYIMSLQRSIFTLLWSFNWIIILLSACSTWIREHFIDRSLSTFRSLDYTSCRLLLILLLDCIYRRCILIFISRHLFVHTILPLKHILIEIWLVLIRDSLWLVDVWNVYVISSTLFRCLCFWLSSSYILFKINKYMLY
jgi:hypothetical protein